MTDRTGVVEFGRELIQTRDLDPVYCAVHHADLGDAQLKRWLLAYWCFYHAGVASAISESEGRDFWDCMAAGAEARLIPRGRERRHFRGQAAIRSVALMRGTFPQPEAAVVWLVNGLPSPCNFRDIDARVQKWPAFGSWIAFKAADMLDRLGLIQVEFPADALTLYREPREGAEMARSDLGLPLDCDPSLAVKALVARICDLLSPPANDRPSGVAEAETVFCKWKAHQRGHYAIGQDTRELRAALNSRWGRTADRMRGWEAAG